MSQFWCLDASFEAIVVPDDVSLEKVKALEVLGANVEIVRPASIVDRKQASPLASPTDCPHLDVSYLSPQYVVSIQRSIDKETDC
jgi:hypothetical protein